MSFTHRNDFTGKKLVYATAQASAVHFGTRHESGAEKLLTSGPHPHPRHRSVLGLETDSRSGGQCTWVGFSG